MHWLKGFAAHELREEFPELRSRLPKMRTGSYSFSTAGKVSATTIRRHLEAQKGRQ